MSKLVVASAGVSGLVTLPLQLRLCGCAVVRQMSGISTISEIESLLVD